MIGNAGECGRIIDRIDGHLEGAAHDIVARAAIVDRDGDGDNPIGVGGRIERHSARCFSAEITHARIGNDRWITGESADGQNLRFVRRTGIDAG